MMMVRVVNLATAQQVLGIIAGGETFPPLSLLGDL